jgi:type I restriction enzyme S subunit
MSAKIHQVPLGELVELRNEKIVANKDRNLPYIGLEHIDQGQPRLLGHLPGDLSISANNIFCENDILFGKLRPNLRKSVRVTNTGYCSTDILVLRALPGVAPSYAGHILQLEAVFNSASASAEGTKMPRTSWSELSHFRVFKPDSESEQTRIARILDTADALIAKSEAILSKLRQVRSGLLHDLLTRGLDAHGQLRDPAAHPEQFKDSPLGRIPREWEVEPLASLLQIVFDYRGRTPLKIGMDWGGGEIAALSAMNVEMGQVNFSKGTNFGSQALHDRWMTNGRTEKGDVLITLEAPLGNVAQVPDDSLYILSQRVVLLRPDPERVAKDYLAIVLAGNAFQKELIRNSSGSTAVGIQRSKLEVIPIAFPLYVEEQIQIAAHLATHDRQIASEQATLSKLRQLKSGLMTDLLEGRVRAPEII